MKKPAAKVIETFNPPTKYAIADMENRSPSCMNGDVHFRKYRVTIELIDEPIEVIADRLQKLYDESRAGPNYNSHHWGPIKAAAKSIGVELKGGF